MNQALYQEAKGCLSVGKNAAASATSDQLQEAIRSAAYHEGYEAAHTVCLRLCSTSEPAARQSLLAEALADMVDINLGWSNLHETQERLCGFAAVLAEQFSLHCAPPSSALTATGTPTHLAVLSFQRA